jgi:hypothetical protein
MSVVILTERNRGPFIMKFPVIDRGALLFVALVGIYLIVFTFLSEINEFIFQFIEPRSEYHAQEQLSKFTLLVVVVIALKCLSQQKDKVLLKLSMVFLIFSITMYLSESNMIKAKLQPLFAALLVPLLLHGFFKKKAWLSVIFFVGGLGVIALGVIKDFGLEHQELPIFELIIPFNEEFLDMLGIGFIGLSALILFYSSLREFAKQGLIVNVLMISVIAMVAVGNGLSHYQYDPSTSLWLTGLLMALVGGVGAFIINQYLIDDEQKLFKGNPYKYYLFLSFFFIFLPSFVDKYKTVTCIVLWMIVIFTSRSLYSDAKSQRPSMHLNQNNNKTS